MNSIIKKLPAMAEAREKENQEFRIFLKGCDPVKVDKIVQQLYQEYSTEYDCTDCGNCCRKLTLTISHEEIRKIARELNLGEEEFKDKFIEREMAEGFTLKGEECPFLQGNKCSIYEFRPEVCRSYPHLHKKNIVHRLLNIIDNTYTCPIVYRVFEDLKEIFWQENRER